MNNSSYSVPISRSEAEKQIYRESGVPKARDGLSSNTGTSDFNT